MTLDAARLLATVRGRRLLWSVLTPTWVGPPWSDIDVDPAPGATAPPPPGHALLASLTALVDGACRSAPSAAALAVALTATVDHARYWQPPSQLEAVLADPASREVLAPLATVVADAAPVWWTAPLDRTGQHRVRWVDTRADATPAGDPATELAAWRRETVEQERWGAARHARTSEPWSGTWWSTPGHRVPHSTRAAAGLPAVHLALVEDEAGWTAADVEPVAVDPAARVYEVTDAHAWATLVAAFPLEVTHARRFDWWETTGRTGRWFLPDFAAVAAHHDAVHIAVAGYLDTAGEAVPVDGTGGATVLAGWSPDQTWWLGSAPRSSGPATRWRRADDPDSPWDWVPAG